jgi:hypothetical protein
MTPDTLTTTEPQPPPMLLEYKRSMEEMRLRLDYVALQHNEVAAMGTVETPASRFRLETGFMHLRKALELMAFSSVIAHKDAYVAAHKNYQKHSRAKDMLNAVEKLNPGFYPIPFDFDAPRKQFSPVADGWLTRDEFIELYDCASELIHVGNPYAEKRVFLRLRLDQWIGRIRRLLEWHGVILLNEKERLMVNVPADLNQPVQVMVAVPSPTPVDAN